MTYNEIQNLKEKFGINSDVCLIYAKDVNNLIGINVTNSKHNVTEFHMPWRMDHKEDLKFFKDTTIGSVCIMGYNTWLSMNQKPLTDRINVVISNRHYDSLRTYYQYAKNVVIVKSFEEALNIAFEHCAATPDLYQRVFVIGGKSLFDLLWNSVDMIFQTTIKAYHQYIHNDTNITTEDIKIQSINEELYSLSELRVRGVYTWEKYNRKK